MVSLKFYADQLMNENELYKIKTQTALVKSWIVNSLLANVIKWGTF